jgi:hypothetical protein
VSIIQELPAQQAVIYQTLFGRADVAIETLHDTLYPDLKDRTRTQKQQVLGPFITRLNRRLVKHRLAVKPGALKGTYTLLSI